jgi:hypothetical protein
LKIFTGELEIFRIGQKYLHWAGNIYNGQEIFTLGARFNILIKIL